MFGYSSSDGIRWKKNDVPILEVEGYLDSQNQLTYDPGRSKYVAYMRGEVNLRRSVREASSREFSRDWSTPKNMLVADSQDPPDVDIYSVGFHYEPESKWRYMFMSMFHRAQDTVNIQLAVSRDGELWSRPERLPIVPTEIDQFYGQNYGQMYCSPGLIEFDEDHWALAVVAKTKTHHDYVFKDNQLLPVVAAGEYRWAIWRRHRLAALEAPLEGSFMLHSLTCISSRLVVNFSAERGGFLAAELVDFSDMPWKALEGFSFEDCDFAYGDQSSHVMSWRGHSDLTKLRGMNLAIRFRMLKAKLFSISV
jgi:hypothetical protein